jgi:alpha/beta superfamily hydrolase
MQLLMRRPEIPKFILLSPPVGKYDFNFLAPCPASGVIISGEKDGLIDKDMVKDVATKLNKQKSISVKYDSVKSADHFFTHQEKKVIEKIKKYISTN